MIEKGTPFLLQILWLLVVLCLNCVSLLMYTGIIDYLEGPLRDTLTSYDYLRFWAVNIALGGVTLAVFKYRLNTIVLAIVTMTFIFDLIIYLLFIPLWNNNQLLPQALLLIIYSMTLISVCFLKMVQK